MINKISQKIDVVLLLVIIMMIILCIALDISLFFGFFASILVSFFILVKMGFSPNHLKEIMLKDIKECSTLCLFILLIGAAVSVWMASGVVPAMIYYGFEYMKGLNFLFAAFLITSFISFFMGTAVGTVSTVGIALLGIGRGFGVPQNVILGVVVSGAFIADKISPISGLLNLLLSSTAITYKEAFRSMLKTMVPVYILSSLIYYFLGRFYITNADLQGIKEYQTAITQSFNISPLLLFIPVGIIIMSIYGTKIVPTITFGLILGVVSSMFLQKMPFSKVVYSILFGYHASTQSDKLNAILISGGVKSMIEVVLIVVGAVALTGLLEKTQILKPIIDGVVSNIRSRGGLILNTGIMSSILTIITCDQTVGIILPGRLLKGKYEELGLQPEILARTISDTGTIIAPLMPWNINGLIIAMITGISAMQYSPYAVLCFLFPFVTIGVSYIVNMRQPILNKDIMD